MSQSQHSKHLIMGAIVILWIALTAAGLWWFQDNTVRPFLGSDDNPATVQTEYLTKQLGSVLEQAGATTPVVMIHFWNPSCLCNQVSRRHFQGLVNSHSSDIMTRLVVTPASTTDQQIEEFQQLNQGIRMTVLRLSNEQLSIPASPAVALFQRTENNQYRLSYFGAYGFGALCTLSDDNFFPNIVSKMQQGRYGPFINIAGSGCFCAWGE